MSAAAGVRLLASRFGAVLALQLLGLGACRQMIGIEEAELEAPATTDPIQTGGAGAGGEPAARADTPAPELTLCERYCVAVMDNCTEAFSVYTSYDSCLAVCARLPAGEEGDVDVDSVHCRLRAASIAGDEVPHYCPIAGPGGNGSCGSNCESLCGLLEATCDGVEATPPRERCLSECQALEDLGTYSTDTEAGQYSGGSVQCRLLHVSAAAAADAEKHCAHASGAAPCE